jgi:hypothetical protein
MLVRIIVPRGTTIEVVEASPVRVLDVEGEEVPPPSRPKPVLAKRAPDVLPLRRIA